MSNIDNSEIENKLNNTFEFFTYPIGIKNNYAIINCKKWLNFKTKSINFSEIEKYSKNYKKVFLEPEVMILKVQKQYRFENWLNVSELLDSLPNNVYFSMDYPPDMNILFSKLFIGKTFENICKYAYSKQYIITIQSNFRDFYDFKFRFNNTMNVISEKSQILAIGNLCRLLSVKDISFVNQIFDYVFNYNNQFNQIHIYGLALRHIINYYKICKSKFNVMSFDSTKWTKSVNTDLKLKYGINCKKSNRQLFFNEYCNTIQKRINNTLVY